MVVTMFRPAKKVEEKPKSNPDEKPKDEAKKQPQCIIKTGGGVRVTRGRLTSEDIISAIQSGDWNIANLLNPHPVKQTTRTNMLVKPEREDLTSLGGVVSPNNAGVQIVAGVAGQQVKVYDAGYEGAVDGIHYFYFGTSTTATTKRFMASSTKGPRFKTFVQPRIGDVGDGLYLFSAVAETNMPYDVGYTQE